ncbi:unnamed protein product [Durusdinium trenchii]|uniref:Phytanoyl-CoA dioxygenase n=1 Tax=Durusdinium trenchii TaxID=1381693 RepID=A0ABP0LDG0_9DINO
MPHARPFNLKDLRHCLLLVGCAGSEVAWNLRVPANEASGPWRAMFKERDPRVEGWTRDPQDERVAALREKLQRSNCMPNLPVFSPLDPDYNVSAVASFFHEHGFVVLEKALPELMLENLKNASGYIMRRIFEEDPEGSFGGGAGKLPHRYSLGSGGDVVLAGAIEYQSLHPDAIWGVLEGPVAEQEVPPAVTINFVLEPLTALNGAMRVVPGSHRWPERPPHLLEEPDWMQFNTLCPLPAGAAIFRDNRCWHGGTPNLSENFRALPNVEFFPPKANPSLGWLDRYTMPWDVWQRLSPLGQYVSRHVVAPPDEEIPGQDFYSPGAILNIMPFLR